MSALVLYSEPHVNDVNSYGLFSNVSGYKMCQFNMSICKMATMCLKKTVYLSILVKKRKEMWTMLTVAGVRLQGWSWEDRGSSDRDMSIVIQNGQPEGNGGADNEKTGPIGLCCSWYS